MKPDTVDEFIADLSPDERAIVETLRDIVRQTVPDVEESALWGGISYHSPWIGGRVKGALCQISAKRGAVKLEFIHGIRLDDPLHLLCGDALSKRFISIGSINEAQSPAIVALIREASAVELDPPR